MSGNKVLFGNVYSTLGDLPNPSTYHGMFCHVQKENFLCLWWKLDSISK